MNAADQPAPEDDVLSMPRGWDAAFYVLTTLSAASMLVAEAAEPRPVLWSVAAIALLMIAYPVLGRRGLLTGDQVRVRVYLVLLVLVVATASGASSLGTLLLFVGFSQIWLLTPSMRSGIAWCAALTVAVAVSVFTGQSLRATDLPELVGQLGIGLLFSVVMGWWLTRIGRSREQREELLGRLRAAEAELAAGHHAAGVLAERARVAQEIHDTLAQGFTSVVMLAQTAQVDDGRATARLEQIESVARENLAEARSLVAAFGPSGLLSEDLPGALHRIAERTRTETGLRVDLTIDGEPPEDRELQVVLLRTAQEALHNVRRHAGATRVALRLTAADQHVRLAVQDDGTGLAPGSADGVGLRGMRQRITAAGGTLLIENTDPGVRVLAELPMRETAG
ncbi:sensor histidine kinase [Cellulomonas taurus]|uniref:sensor histidine kinase n=1 Tax=Cellulomonas taurus TaxID=2729175 RepID=UPI00145E1FAF|nr:sensor histidine kinase [Cellulomonas taurus]